MASYLTEAEADTRLQNIFDIEHESVFGRARLASAKIDQMGPFIGIRYGDTQALAFPRSVTLDGDTEGVVPEAVLNLAALLTYRATAPDAGVAVTSESARGLSRSYAAPKTGATDSLVALALEDIKRYQRKTGTTT